MKLFLTIIIIFVSSIACGQSLRGTILSLDRNPLEGVYLINLRTNNHAHTNESGIFTMKEMQPGDSVKITHIGYSTQVITYAKDTIQIVLDPHQLQLQDVLVTSNGVRHLNVISNIDLQTTPVNSSQDLLRKVPGLFTGQHAGGGKAEQIFLRGFDIDHGTDINISVDGMPVNMVSHAHGQGYADMHFLIPESVEKIDFDKGPYHANKGNLATAGYVSFITKDRLENNFVTEEIGRFNTFRTVNGFNLLNTEKESAYFIGEYLRTNGPFESPQNFNRVNLMGKYTTYLPDQDKLSFSLSHFTSKWDASGQIPERAVSRGTINRFGAIDDTEGGNTGRTNLNLQFKKFIDDDSFLRNTAYFSNYNFELYSNFTFFLKDSVNGDQIRQKEKRNIIGFESELNKEWQLGNTSINLQAGTGLRYDAIRDIELSHTVNRTTVLKKIQLGNIDETNLYAYVNTEVKKGKWLFNPALRFDHFNFEYADKLAAFYKTEAQSKSIISPKLNLLYNQRSNLQYFFKLGKGFHSNDTRVVTDRSARDILPSAYGVDAGFSWKPVPSLIVNSALWYLQLQQEFVYVGDEGIVEPGGKTGRKGFDLGLRYQLSRSWFLNSDLTYTHARNLEEVKGTDYIPLAPKFTFTGAISFTQPSGFAGSIKSRYLSNRPANEDNSIVAKGYLITDCNLNYEWKSFNLGFIAENIFNKQWNETQFATESMLRNESQSVTEIHFTPGTPFNIRAVITCKL